MGNRHAVSRDQVYTVDDAMVVRSGEVLAQYISMHVTPLHYISMYVTPLHYISMSHH